jgi:DNA modification methylase
MRHSGWLCCAAVLSFATALQLPARRGSDSLPWPCDVPATSAALPAHRQHRQLTFPIRRTHLNSPLIIGQIERRTVDQLIAYSKNARTHSAAQIDQIAASIMEFGFTNPILVGPDNVIIAGHARHRAARQLGLPEVTVIVLAHLSEAQRHALAIADNQLALNASWDEELLRAELAALAEENIDLTLLGFDDGALAHLLEQDAAQDLEDGGAVPAPPVTPITVVGDQWRMGDHLLLCGDATNRVAIDTLLAGAGADMVFTDPPYNVDYEGKTAHKLRIDNDALGRKFYQFLREACANLLAVCHGAIYVCMSSSELHTLFQAFTDAGGHWSTFVIWAKHHFTLGRSDYQRQYEPILYGWRQGGEHFWCGARNQGDVWFIPRPSVNREHPTMKPVELVEQAVKNSSRPGDLVLDPFAGSGTTLIACIRQRRRARLLELDGRYADVICRRWQQYTGKEAVLDGDGRTFDDVAQSRLRRAA